MNKGVPRYARRKQRSESNDNYKRRQAPAYTEKQRVAQRTSTTGMTR